MASSSRPLDTGDNDDAAPSTKKDLKELKEDLLKSFTSLVTELLQPLQTQLNEMAKDLNDTSNIAENTAELNATGRANVHFRWSPTSDIHVHRNGLLYQASDAITGKALISSLGIKSTLEEEHKEAFNNMKNMTS
ncbi:UNVERIFIED_CONTAM: hypothetical protein K2H54_047109 [Gekko kuhli]